MRSKNKKGLLSSWLNKKRDYLSKRYIRGDVLDVGGGKATIYTRYKNMMKSYVCIEKNEDIIKSLKRRGVPVVKLDLDIDFIKDKKRYDTILLLAVIEHIFNQKHLFIQLKKVLGQKGKIIITTPTIVGNFVHMIGSKIGFFDKDAHDDHIVIYSKDRFNTLAKEMNLRLSYYKRFQFGCNQIAILSN
jgi:2-polyprenyl-3-methyl-5-hydroxy-6-metoxy-1,4-benzoquinol methylase